MILFQVNVETVVEENYHKWKNLIISKLVFCNILQQRNDNKYSDYRYLRYSEII